MRNFKKANFIIISLVGLLLAVLALSGCSTPTPVELNISAAASLTGVLKEINALYTQENPNVTITPNFASSGTLQQQIEQGAPADVFISAGAKQMDTLQTENLVLNDTRQNIVANTLVMIVPTNSTLGLTSFNDLTLDKVKKIAVGDSKSVPAGTYAKMAFDELGITAKVTPKEVIGADVRQVLTYVETGDVDAGLVFITDAYTSSKVRIIASAPADVNAKIIYPLAVLKSSKNVDAAKAYISFLFSDKTKTIFEIYGFTMVSN
jgi:molybdate transport system substrate-binding protein